MKRFTVLLSVVLTALQPGRAQEATVAAPVSVAVDRACVLLGGVTPSPSTVVVKCTLGSVAPVSPLEVASLPVQRWVLVTRARDADGGELFTYAVQTADALESEINFN